jgi:hypothetical protein
MNKVLTPSQRSGPAHVNPCIRYAPLDPLEDTRSFATATPHPTRLLFCANHRPRITTPRHATRCIAVVQRGWQTRQMVAAPTRWTVTPHRCIDDRLHDKCIGHTTRPHHIMSQPSSFFSTQSQKRCGSTSQEQNERQKPILSSSQHLLSMRCFQERSLAPSSKNSQP